MQERYGVCESVAESDADVQHPTTVAHIGASLHMHAYAVAGERDVLAIMRDTLDIIPALGPSVGKARAWQKPADEHSHVLSRHSNKHKKLIFSMFSLSYNIIQLPLPCTLPQPLN